MASSATDPAPDADAIGLPAGQRDKFNVASHTQYRNAAFATTLTGYATLF
jgi:hypothetical protein